MEICLMIYGLVQERLDSSALAVKLHFYPAALKGSGVLSYPERVGGRTGGRADKPR